MRKVIKLTQGQNYSWVFRKYTDAVELIGADKIGSQVRHEMSVFMRGLHISDPAEQEFAAVFAIAFAGAVIAAQLIPVGLGRENIESAIARYYRMTRGEMIAASIPEQLEDEDIERLRSKLRGSTVLFLPWLGNKHGCSVEEVQKAEAFYRTAPYPAGWIVPVEILTLWCGVEKTRVLMRGLRERGDLILEKSRPNVNTYQLNIKGMPDGHRYVVIDASFANPEPKAALIKPNPTSIENQNGPQLGDSLLARLISHAPPAKEPPAEDEEQS